MFKIIAVTIQMNKFVRVMYLTNMSGPNQDRKQTKFLSEPAFHGKENHD